MTAERTDDKVGARTLILYLKKQKETVLSGKKFAFRKNGKKPKIVVAAITGGPCSGKTTFIPKLMQVALKEGIKVYYVPETATEIFDKLVNPAVIMKDKRGRYETQRQIFLTQLRKEDMTIALAKQMAQIEQTDRILIVCDRTALDGAVYMDSFWSMVRKLGYEPKDVFARYDVGICFATTAKGAEEHYTLENNAARIETPEQARELDTKIQELYMSIEHTHYGANIDGSGNKIGFEEKMNRAIGVILNEFGMPLPLENEVKHLVLDKDFSEKRLRHYASDKIVKQKITQNYLISGNKKIERRIRKIEVIKPFRAQYYVYVEKRLTKDPISRLESPPHILTHEQYKSLLYQVDPRLKTIEKIRYYFMYKNHNGVENRGQLDRILKPVGARDTWIYEHESLNTNELATHKPPSFLGKTEDVTNRLSNHFMAKNGAIAA